MVIAFVQMECFMEMMVLIVFINVVIHAKVVMKVNVLVLKIKYTALMEKIVAVIVVINVKLVEYVNVSRAIRMMLIFKNVTMINVMRVVMEVV
jgi:hypothetical protein